jgi:hypothetical protein
VGGAAPPPPRPIKISATDHAFVEESSLKGKILQVSMRDRYNVP